MYGTMTPVLGSQGSGTRLGHGGGGLSKSRTGRRGGSYHAITQPLASTLVDISGDQKATQVSAGNTATSFGRYAPRIGSGQL